MKAAACLLGMKFGLDRKAGFKVTSEKVTAEDVRNVADELGAISGDVQRFLAEIAFTAPSGGRANPA